MAKFSKSHYEALVSELPRTLNAILANVKSVSIEDQEVIIGQLGLELGLFFREENPDFDMNKWAEAWDKRMRETVYPEQYRNLMEPEVDL